VENAREIVRVKCLRKDEEKFTTSIGDLIIIKGDYG